MENHVPEEFLCPITFDMMEDPVCTVDGHSYDRHAITRWFSEGRTTSPATGLGLASTALATNFGLRKAIANHGARAEESARRERSRAEEWARRESGMKRTLEMYRDATAALTNKLRTLQAQACGGERGTTTAAQSGGHRGCGVSIVDSSRTRGPSEHHPAWVDFVLLVSRMLAPSEDPAAGAAAKFLAVDTFVEAAEAEAGIGLSLLRVFLNDRASLQNCGLSCARYLSDGGDAIIIERPRAFAEVCAALRARGTKRGESVDGCKRRRTAVAAAFSSPAHDAAGRSSSAARDPSFHEFAAEQELFPDVEGPVMAPPAGPRLQSAPSATTSSGSANEIRPSSSSGSSSLTASASGSNGAGTERAPTSRGFRDEGFHRVSPQQESMPGHPAPAVGQGRPRPNTSFPIANSNSQTFQGSTPGLGSVASQPVMFSSGGSSRAGHNLPLENNPTSNGMIPTPMSGPMIMQPLNYPDPNSSVGTTSTTLLYQQQGLPPQFHFIQGAAPTSSSAGVYNYPPGGLPVNVNNSSMSMNMMPPLNMSNVGANNALYQQLGPIPGMTSSAAQLYTTSGHLQPPGYPSSSIMMQEVQPVSTNLVANAMSRHQEQPVASMMQHATNNFAPGTIADRPQVNPAADSASLMNLHSSITAQSQSSGHDEPAAAPAARQRPRLRRFDQTPDDLSRQLRQL
ncbi:unnamed protein product [Amoebophrya sp. A120]|nr:unnamed protein product [Amoebophrya sp. A120]|eukprot:GSA120T00001336001.1